MSRTRDTEKIKGFKHQRPIPIAVDVAAFLQRVRMGQIDEPRVLRDFAKDWPAVRLWEEDYLVSRCGDARVRPALGLPSHGVPYLVAASAVRHEMSFKEFWQGHVTKTDHCYLEQQSLAELPRVAADVRIAELLGENKHAGLNMWLGRGTKSGMHFDGIDNFLIMIRGTKFAALAAPEAAKRLYPFKDSMTKSQLDIEAPDFEKYPRTQNVRLWTTRLESGDVLFIPIRWWHYLAAPTGEHSISVNCFFGRKGTASSALRYIFSLGPPYVAQLLRDFMVHGMLGRPYSRRHYSPPREGVVLYKLVRAKLLRLLGLAPNPPATGTHVDGDRSTGPT